MSIREWPFIEVMCFADVWSKERRIFGSQNLSLFVNCHPYLPFRLSRSRKRRSMASYLFFSDTVS